MMMMKDVRLVSKMEGRPKSNFKGIYRLSGTGIVECLKIIDVRCNLKQFDVGPTGRPKIYFSFSAVNENADKNEIPFSAEKRKRKRKSPVHISQNLVTVHLRT